MEKDSMPKIRPISPPLEVPVFNIVIYVSRIDGKVKARVANLPDLVFTAGSEPVVLKQTISEVKNRLGQWHKDQCKIPWVDPVPPAANGEQERFVPVHL